MIHVHEKWLEAADNNLIAASCYLDQSAAYDLLCHRTLAEKLKLYKFDQLSIDWVMSYLGGRTTTVQVESKVSKIINKLGLS